MPISATANRSAEHWQDFQVLLHRGISNAGFAPVNVWESTSTDRISERIIGNIFEVPIAVADISDQNPNVMLELGLRLASRKPTVVITNSGGTIPFDIRDFRAIFYPENMNMLGMEEFFANLSRILKERYEASQKSTYTPFLGKVIVDVASPETREVEMNQLILSELEDITRRLRSLEATGQFERTPRSAAPVQPLYEGKVGFTIPEANWTHFLDDIREFPEVDQVNKSSSDGHVVKGKIYYSRAQSMTNFYNRLEELLAQHGGERTNPLSQA